MPTRTKKDPVFLGVYFYFLIVEIKKVEQNACKEALASKLVHVVDIWIKHLLVIPVLVSKCLPTIKN